MATLTFSERLARRRHDWWRTSRSPLTAQHRFRDLRSHRRRTDPDEVWRCCASWQRTLLNKWNAREFAARYGCPVPELYWTGGATSRPPFESLPDHYVVRPVRGAGMHGVQVVGKGVELLRGEPATPAEMHRRYRLRSCWRELAPLLIEEFARSEEGAHHLPVEYKVHTFGVVVAAIERIERTDGDGLRKGLSCHYTAEWEPIREMLRQNLVEDVPRGPPACLDEILRHASSLGGQTETYMRVDLFATDRGPLFNEFSSVTNNGEGFTPFGDEYFGEFWDRYAPDGI